MTTYRACYFTKDGRETVLTSREHAQLSDDELLAEAIAEAHRADIIGDELPRITLAQLRAGLVIGDWTQ